MVDGRQPGEGSEPQALAKTFEKSDAVVVPGKSAKTWVTPVELMEGRTKAKGIPAGRNAPPTQGGTRALTNLQRVGHRAQQKPADKWTNLLSHIRGPLLEEAYLSLQKAAAPGADGIDWETYGERLPERLTDLCDRIHRGAYHPQPVRRVEIPKADGKSRPLSVGSTSACRTP
jgi:hypothetical protein